MNILVTYKSKTGFAKWYAEVITKKVDGQLVEFSKVTAEMMSQYDVVIYGGGLYAGMINGFKKAKEMFNSSKAKKLVVFATGATPEGVTDKIDEMWKVNLSEEEMTNVPHYYMPGGICYEKMSFFSRIFMKMMAGPISKEMSKSSGGQELPHSLKTSHNISDEKYAETLVSELAK